MDFQGGMNDEEVGHEMVRTREETLTFYFFIFFFILLFPKNPVSDEVKLVGGGMVGKRA